MIEQELAEFRRILRAFRSARTPRGVHYAIEASNYDDACTVHRDGALVQSDGSPLVFETEVDAREWCARDAVSAALASGGARE